MESASAGERSGVFEALRSIWRAIIPKDIRSWFGTILIDAARSGLFGPREGPVPGTRACPSNPCDVVVSGLINDPSGVGEGARAALRGLQAAGYAASAHDIRTILEKRIDRSVGLDDGPEGLWVLSCNPPELLRLFAALRPSPIGSRYRVGFWAWELERLPPRWASAAEYLDEIWVPSHFVAEAVIRSLDRNARRPVVRVVPLPVDCADFAIAATAAPASNDSAVSILVMFDLNSSRARKNPDAALDAYCKAFPEPGPHRRLICKVNGTQGSPFEYTALRSRYGSRSDVVFMDEILTRSELARLIGSVDIVLSTHRSEGYGLVLAEAMSLGKCVVATGWSGNTDFMTESNSILLPYRLVPVSDSQGIYREGSNWADVDVDAAASILASICNDAETRCALGRQARADIRRHDARFATSLWSRDMA